MELTVLGCSGSVSGPDSAASCYLVTQDGFALLLDLGPGGFGALWAVRDPGTVGAVLLSHLHPDHCLDLCAFNVAAKFSPTAPWDPVPVYGPANTRERMERAYLPALDDPDNTWNVEFRTWAATQQIGPFTVQVARTPHSTEAYAIRLEAEGTSLVYSGDTGPSRALTDLARNADLLLCEAAFLHHEDLPADLHLSGGQAADHATAAGVRTLVITHIPPWHDPARVFAEARPRFAGELLIARPGLVVGVPTTGQASV